MFFLAFILLLNYVLCIKFIETNNIESTESCGGEI